MYISLGDRLSVAALFHPLTEAVRCDARRRPLRRRRAEETHPADGPPYFNQTIMLRRRRGGLETLDHNFTHYYHGASNFRTSSRNSWHMALRSRLGIRNVWGISSFVFGDVRLPRPSQDSIARRSYEKPSAAMTGSS